MLHLYFLLFLLTLTSLTPPAVQADYTTTINPAAGVIWQGWGCSLAWWANVFGTRDDLADIVFTTKNTVLNGQTLPGLGMTIARYNAGGCTTTAINGAVMHASPHIPAFKQIQGYWLNWYNSAPTSSSWNWDADAKQRAMLGKARSRGANKFELFSNSPLWWMCSNSNPSGADNGADNNLQSWNYRQHAVYLATVARYAHDNWGITFDSVEAFNEPSAAWWNSAGTQEGCHFDAATQATVIGYLRAELNKRGLSEMNVSASDENTYDQATRTWSRLSAAIRSQAGRVNVHGYQYGGGRRDLLADAVAGKNLWNSEYGESDGTGMSLADNLNLDMRWLHPTAWCYWQPFDSGGWGLIQSNPGDKWIGSANPKYFVLAQYTRHIRPGMTLLGGDDANTVAAYDSAAHSLVLVTANHGTGQWITYDLSRFNRVGGNAGGKIDRWATQTGGGDMYASHADTFLRGKGFKAYFPPNTVQTFVINNVKL